MIKKKAMALMLALTMVLGLSLAGCSNSGSSSSTGKSNGNDQAAGSGKKVTVNFMRIWPSGVSNQQNSVVESIVKDFESKNPNIKIHQEVLQNEQYKNKLKVLSASNQLPDVGVTWAAGFLKPYVKGNLFAPLNDVLDSGLKDSFVPGTTAAYAVDGKTYGLPLELNITPVFYNKAIFDKYHLQVPKTYADFKNVVTTLVAHGVAPIALGNKDRWTGSLWFMYLADRIGGPEAIKNAINRSGSFENPNIIKAAQDIQDLVKMKAFEKGFNGLSDQEAKAEFNNGKAAMYLMGSWMVPSYTTDPKIPDSFKKKIGYFKFPTVSRGKGDINSWVGGPGVGLFVSQNSKVKPEAKKFVKFFMQKWGEQAVTKAGVIPATKVDTSKVDLPQMYIDVLNELNNASNITLFADVQMSPAVAQVHLNEIQALFGLQTTPKEFAKKQEDALKQESK